MQVVTETHSYKEDITLREKKGTELTHSEMDSNFKALSSSAGKCILVDNQDNRGNSTSFDVTLFSFNDDDIEALKNVQSIYDGNEEVIGYIECSQYGENGDSTDDFTDKTFILAMSGESEEIEIYGKSPSVSLSFYPETKNFIIKISTSNIKLVNAKVVFFDVLKNDNIYPNTDLSYELSPEPQRD